MLRNLLTVKVESSEDAELANDEFDGGDDDDDEEEADEKVDEDDEEEGDIEDNDDDEEDNFELGISFFIFANSVVE